MSSYRLQQVALAAAVLFIPSTEGQTQAKRSVHRDALDTVNRYVQLRLGGARWAEFQNLIDWSDEPGWDCNWVSGGFHIGSPQSRATGVVIPVSYHRLGFYCHDFTIRVEKTIETVRYELVKSSMGWKIKAPEPDYPDLDIHAVISELQSAARNSSETPERRSQAERVARQLSSLKSRTQ